MDEQDILQSAGAVEYYRINCLGTDEYFDDLCLIIADVIAQWCGNTYVGQEKHPIIRDLFQHFYENLAELVATIRLNPEKVIKDERKLAQSLIYTGDIYRYLGHSSLSDCKEIVEPQYNKIYVSWSKESGDSYLLSKLYGPITLVQGKIRDSEFGLDLEGFTEFYHNRVENKFMIARPNEHEVVFPTIEKNTVKIEYLYDRCL